MYVEVEQSGCCERKGLMQVRYCMYLEPGDYGYEKQHVKEKKAEFDNPFHNHFVYVEPGITDETLLDIGQSFLEEAYVKWAQDKPLDLVNPPTSFPGKYTGNRISLRLLTLPLQVRRPG